MALLAGYGISAIRNLRLRVFLAAAIAVESLLNQQHDLRIPPSMIYKTELEGLVNKFVSREGKIILNTGPNIQQLYFANRKGWLLDAPALIRKNALDSLSGFDFSLVVLDRAVNTAYDSAEFRVLYSDAHYLLLKEKE
jgi:hypothetical protein